MSHAPRRLLQMALASLAACGLLLLGVGALAGESWRAGSMGGRGALGQLLLLGAIALALLVFPALAGALLSRALGGLPRTGAVLLPLAVAGSAFYIILGAMLTDARPDRALAMLLVSSVTLFLSIWLIATEQASWRRYAVLLGLGLLLARLVPLAGLPIGVLAWVLLPTVLAALDRRRGDAHPPGGNGGCT